MKGSSVNRSTIKDNDTDIDKYKNRILKDTDFKILNMKLLISKSDSSRLQALITEDSEFLKTHYLTDYSLLISIHKYRDEDFQKFKDNYRVLKSSDSKYLYSLAIIDYLGVKFDNFRNMIFIKWVKL
jgi:hypothetical protein